MAIVVFNGNSYECARAVKGVDYIKLYDENNAPVVAFYKISDFSAFTLEEGMWEQGVCTDIVGATAELINNNIRLKLIGSAVVETGLTITFKAPCHCTKAGNIVIQDTPFSMVNAIGIPVASNFEAFKAEALVTIILNLEDKKAYIQNADASQIENGGTGATTVEEARKNLGVPSTKDVDDAVKEVKGYRIPWNTAENIGSILATPPPSSFVAASTSKIAAPSESSKSFKMINSGDIILSFTTRIASSGKTNNPLLKILKNEEIVYSQNNITLLDGKEFKIPLTVEYGDVITAYVYAETFKDDSYGQLSVEVIDILANIDTPYKYINLTGEDEISLTDVINALVGE